MSPLCGCCGEHVNQLQQQVSVMRNEIKNLRHLLDIAVRSHRKHMTAIQSAVSKTALSQKTLCEPEKHQKPSLTSPQAAALEQGRIKTVPIGYISSCFSVKNGTPRQPTICGPSKAELRLQQSIFNNPQHALLGLEQYSHVWIIFMFHKNGHLNYKAKVKPPRLNGKRVGVYSTRSPHRPNALGLTLAKLDQIIGDTIHLSNIDMIDGTPVLDIKPYIPDYDSPYTRMSADSHQPQETPVSLKENTDILTFDKDSETDAQSDLNSETIDNDYDDMGSNISSDQSHVLNQNKPGASCLPKDVHKLLQDVQAYVKQEDLFQLPPDKQNQVSASPKAKPANSPVERLCYGAEAYSTIAGWIREAPVESLEVRFTPHAERQLAEFLPAHLPGPSESDRPRFKFLSSPDEAAAGIRGVLSADPRSVYFRTRCTHRLFFFTLDTADVTCWFGPGFAEVLNVRPV